LGTALAQVDIVVGGAFLSDGQIGLYGLLRRLTNLVVMPVSVATWVSSVPVAKAYGAGDRAALGHASRQASSVAMVPGLVLLGAGVVALAVLQLRAFQMWGAEGNWVCLILLGGAGLQLMFAATFTVATLCKLAHFAALARLCSVVVYVVGVVLIPVMTPISNAIIYSVALTVGNLLLWIVVQRRLGVDTSARVLLHSRREVRWNLS
jgi:O-antigen/teichoic acid export membrane protein